MQGTFGQVIPVIPPEHPTKNESVWSAHVDIRKVTENGNVTYEVEYQYCKGDTRIDAHVRKCLTEFARQLPTQLPE